MSDSTLSIQNNPEKSRFEADLGDGSFAVVEYMDRGERIVYTHTEVPQGHEGKGIASQLAKHVLDFAREKHKQVIPLCPYIAGYLRRHLEYQDIVLPGYRY